MNNSNVLKIELLFFFSVSALLYIVGLTYHNIMFLRIEYNTGKLIYIDLHIYTIIKLIHENL